MSAFRSLLLPTDFGEPSAHAVELAIELALQSDAKLTLAHFWEVPGYPYLGAIYSSADFVTPIGQAAEAQLAAVLATVQQRVPRATSVCRMGSPWEQILHLVAELNADLVVMGTHGRRGVSHVLLGSVAERVVRHSPVPVLTVPPTRR